MKFIKESQRKGTSDKLLKESKEFPMDFISNKINEYLSSLDAFLLILEEYIQNRKVVLSNQDLIIDRENSRMIGEYLIEALKAKTLIMENYKRYIDMYS